MIALEMLQLGENGAAWFRDRLKHGNAISRAVRHRFDHVNPFAPLPAGTPLARAEEVETGGISGPRSTNAWLAALFRQAFLDVPHWCFLIEDSWARRGDRPRPRCTRFHAGDTMLFGVAEPDAAGIDRAMSAPLSFDTQAFAAAVKLPAEQELDPDFIARFADATRFALVSAYDGEGVVMARAEYRDRCPGSTRDDKSDCRKRNRTSGCI